MQYHVLQHAGRSELRRKTPNLEGEDSAASKLPGLVFHNLTRTKPQREGKKSPLLVTKALNLCGLSGGSS